MFGGGFMFNRQKQSCAIFLTRILKGFCPCNTKIWSSTHSEKHLWIGRHPQPFSHTMGDDQYQESGGKVREVTSMAASTHIHIPFTSCSMPTVPNLGSTDIFQGTCKNRTWKGRENRHHDARLHHGSPFPTTVRFFMCGPLAGTTVQELQGVNLPVHSDLYVFCQVVLIKKNLITSISYKIYIGYLYVCHKFVWEINTYSLVSCKK